MATLAEEKKALQIAKKNNAPSIIIKNIEKKIAVLQKNSGENKSKKVNKTFLNSLTSFMKYAPGSQIDAVLGKDELYDTLKQLDKQLSAIPKTPSDKEMYNNVISAHYFRGGSDWYVIDVQEDDGVYFCFTILNGDAEMAEFGYPLISDLKKSTELDFHWEKASLKDVLLKGDHKSYFKTKLSPKKHKKTPSNEEQAKKKDKPQEKPKVSKKQSKTPSKMKKTTPAKKTNAKMMVHLSDSYKVIRQYKGWQGKIKTRHQVRVFLKRLQRLILEQKIRNTDKYASEIETIQRALINFVNKVKTRGKINISEKNYSAYKKIVYSQKQRYSTLLLKRFINLVVDVSISKAKKFSSDVEKSLTSPVKVSKSDPYYKDVLFAKAKIDGYIDSYDRMRNSKNKMNQKIKFKYSELSGLSGLQTHLEPFAEADKKKR